MRFWCLNAIVLLAFLYPTNAFSFSAGPATQCDGLSLSWTGGQAPFQLLMTSVSGDSPRNVSIPATAQGSFSIQLPFPEGHRILLTMSDATGFGSGGTTNILTVGASVSGSTCDTTDPGVAYTFQLNTVLQQCRPYTFSGYSGATQPVTIMALIPRGQSTVLHPPVESTTFDWLANVEAGTSMIFVMVDSQGRQGGSSDVETVGFTNDRTCLNGSSPSSTPALIPTSTPKLVPTSSLKPTVASTTRSKHSNSAGSSTGVIAGAVTGALVALAAFVTLGLFFIKRRHNNRPYGEQRSHRNSRRLQSIDNIHYQSQGQWLNSYPYPQPSLVSSGPPSAAHFIPREPFHGNPYVPPPPPQTSYDMNPIMRQPPLEAPYHANPNAPPQRAPSSDAGSNKLLQCSPDDAGLYTRRPPSPSLLPYDNDPDVLPESSRPSRSGQHALLQSPRFSHSGAVANTIASQKTDEAESTSHRPTRFVLHTDVDELQPDEDGAVELPPQYSNH
jgi:hypothetical protein